MMLYWDGAPANLRYDDCAKTTGLVGAITIGALSTGETREIAPWLSRPIGRSSAGILGAIGRKKVKRDYLSKLTSGGKWKFLRIVVDFSAVNLKTVRIILAETMQYKGY